MKLQYNHHSHNGFTLVELAIVLMIIGLLIGGVLRGQELLANARIASTIEQVKAYTGAVHTFGEEYGSVPGDMPLATAKLPGCTASNSCVNGTGDGIASDVSAGGGHFANEPWQPVTNDINSENTQFWKHLALAHMITGVDPSAKVPEWGKTHPVSKMGNAGFFLRYTNFNVVNWPAQWTGHIVVLRQDISGNLCAGGGFCATSPVRAAQLDRKMDDGVAATGDVWGMSQNWNGGCGLNNYGLNGPNGYNESMSEYVCDVEIKIF